MWQLDQFDTSEDCLNEAVDINIVPMVESFILSGAFLVDY